MSFDDCEPHENAAHYFAPLQNARTELHRVLHENAAGAYDYAELSATPDSVTVSYLGLKLVAVPRVVVSSAAHRPVAYEYTFNMDVPGGDAIPVWKFYLQREVNERYAMTTGFPDKGEVIGPADGRSAPKRLLERIVPVAFQSPALHRTGAGSPR